MTLTPTKGHLLVAEPSGIGDMTFNRSVVLLADHTMKGSIGFILNKPLKHTLSDLIDGLGCCDIPVYQGGPVEEDNLYFIHTVPHLIEDSQEISAGIYWGGNFERAIDLVLNCKINATQIKFFLGYSGWASHQLDAELDQRSWVVVENSDTSKLLEVNPPALWREKIIGLGGDYVLWSNTPENPQCN